MQATSVLAHGPLAVAPQSEGTMFQRMDTALQGLVVEFVRPKATAVPLVEEVAPAYLLGGCNTKYAMNLQQLYEGLRKAVRSTSGLNQKVGLALRAQLIHWGSVERPRQILELSDKHIRLFGDILLEKTANGTICSTGTKGSVLKHELSTLFNELVTVSNMKMATYYAERLSKLVEPVLDLFQPSEHAEVWRCIDLHISWVTEGSLLPSLWGKNNRLSITVKELAKHAWTTGILSRQAYGLGLKMYGIHLTGWQYNLVVKNLSALTARNAETPNLLPMVRPLDINSTLLNASQTAIAERRELFMKHGMTPAGWRWLTKQGVTWIRTLMPTDEFNMSRELTKVSRMSNELARRQVSRMPWRFTDPTQLARYVAEDPLMAPLVRVAVEAIRRRQVTARSVRSTMDLVYDFVRNGHPVEKGATWASLQRRQHEWHEEQHRQNNIAMRRKQPTYGWSPLVAEMEHKGYRAISLNESAALYEEGDAMRHCVGGYSPDCHGGRSRIYTMLLPDGTRFATLEVAFDKKAWFWRQLRGYRNAKITDKTMIALSHKVVSACQAAYAADHSIVSAGLWRKEPEEPQYRRPTQDPLTAALADQGLLEQEDDDTIPF